MRPLSPKLLILLAVPLLCAAATQSAPAVDRTRLAEAMGLAPGLWSTTIVIETMELEPLPGHPPVPERVLAAVQASIGQPATNDDCVAARPPPGDDLLVPGVRIGLGCPVEILEAAAGRLRYRASCNGGGFVGETSGEASYTATSIEGRHRLTASSAGTGVRVRTTMRAVSRHEGQCFPRAPRPGG